MTLTFESLKEEDVKKIASWEYPEPYHIYNWGGMEGLEPSEPILDPVKRQENFLRVIDNQGHFMGFVEFSEPDTQTARLGLGLHPDFCGKGLGGSLMLSIMDEVKRRYPDRAIDLEVLSWNKRAYKLYKKCGFETVVTYKRQTPVGMGEFLRMVYRG